MFGIPNKFFSYTGSDGAKLISYQQISLHAAASLCIVRAPITGDKLIFFLAFCVVLHYTFINIADALNS